MKYIIYFIISINFIYICCDSNGVNDNSQTQPLVLPGGGNATLPLPVIQTAQSGSSGIGSGAASQTPPATPLYAIGPEIDLRASGEQPTQNKVNVPGVVNPGNGNIPGGTPGKSNDSTKTHPPDPSKTQPGNGSNDKGSQGSQPTNILKIIKKLKKDHLDPIQGKNPQPSTGQ